MRGVLRPSLRTMQRGTGGCVWAALLSISAVIRGQELSPSGRNVCKTQGSSAPVCCPGWKQQHQECPIALCQGNFTCKANEICVRPNQCRCRHGYFGANCDTKCPERFWGPDCKEMCLCHPNGRCADATGKCTCNPNRWGPTCNKVCLCHNGKCDQDTGRCKCDPHRWGTTCSNICYCSANSQCDPKTGKCICQPGWWGRSCHSQCPCNNSPCDQMQGRCQCKERFWGPRCERCQCSYGKCNPINGSCACYPGYRGKYCSETCPAGSFGHGCRRRCGQCKDRHPCTIVDGRCLACEPGWNGTRCDKICSVGFYGDGCRKQCPRCKDGHSCNHITGRCQHCNPGWIGAQCEVKCQNGTYGENCNSVCTDCFNGTCHFVTGECICHKGFHGLSCNMTCPSGLYGANCAHPCPCIEANCDPVYGTCILGSNGRVGVIAAGSLILFLLLLLLLFSCCYCLCHKKNQGNDTNQDITVRGKQARRRLRGTISQISTKLPRIPIKRQKFPKVVVAHHDMENTLNCSFIEPPSMMDQPSPSWSSHGSFSSFDTADDGPVYCVPHEESMVEMGVREKVTAMERAIGEDDAGEYTCLKGDPGDMLLLKLSDSEASSDGSSAGSTSGAVYAKVARLSKQSKDSDISTNTNTTGGGSGSGKQPSPERTKPPPPDPATKPKLSWIHGKFSPRSPSLDKGAEVQPEGRRGNPSECGRPEDKRRETAEVRLRGKDRPPGEQEPGNSGSGSSSSSKVQQRSRGSPQQQQQQLPSLNGGVQSPSRRGGPPPPPLPGDKKPGEGRECPRSPPRAKGRPEVVHPHLSPEAVTMLAAQLKVKTQSLNKVEGSSIIISSSSSSNARQNGLSPTQQHQHHQQHQQHQQHQHHQQPQQQQHQQQQHQHQQQHQQREKPTPPQKAKRSFGANSPRAVIPTTSNLQKMLSPPADGRQQPAVGGSASLSALDRCSFPERLGVNCSGRPQQERAGEQTPRRTPIQKPPRKRGKDSNTLEPHVKSPAPSPPRTGRQGVVTGRRCQSGAYTPPTPSASTRGAVNSGGPSESES